MVFAWPTNDIPEPLNPTAFSTDSSLLYPGPTVPELVPGYQPDGATRPGKRRRKSTSSQETKKAQALALLKEVLPDDLFAKVRQLIEEGSQASQGIEAAHHLRQMILEKNVASPKKVSYTNRQPWGSSYLSARNSKPSVNTSSNSQEDSCITVQYAQHSGLVSAASSSCHDETSSNRTILDRNDLEQRTMYSCTFPSCVKTNGSKYQWKTKYHWKRHEESIHKRRFMCKECKECEECEEHNSPILQSSGVYGCSLCLEQLVDLEAANFHVALCDMPKSERKEYGRIDHLRNHLRKKHGILEVNEDAFDMFYDLDTEWTRECGFCGVNFHDWELRANHIEIHFKNGWTISEWKIPFPRDKLNRREGPKDGPRDKRDDDDDDDDDDGSDNDDSNHDSHDHKGKGRMLARGYTQTRDRSTYNEVTSSGMDWNYGFSTNTPLLSDELDVSAYTTSSGKVNTQAIYTPIPYRATVLPYSLLSHLQTSSTIHHIASTERFGKSVKKRYRVSAALEAYLSDQQQHERLLLGAGRRRPLNVYIGTESRSERLRCPSLPPSDLPPIGKIVQSGPISPPNLIASPGYPSASRSRFSEDVTSQAHEQRNSLSDELQHLPHCSIATAKSDSSEVSIFEPSISLSLSRTSECTIITSPQRSICPEIKNTLIMDRLQMFCLGNSDPFAIGYHPSRAIHLLESPEYHGKSAKASSLCNTNSSQQLSRRSSSCSNVSSCTDSTRTFTSSAPSLNGPLPWYIGLNTNADIPSTPISRGYYLPCEFRMLGCTALFHSAHFEGWIEHSLTHFPGDPPPKTICPFCDDQDAVFENQHNPALSWQDRMHHVHEHYQNHANFHTIRPDYWLIDYFNDIGALSHEDYRTLFSYTERPHFAEIDGLVPNDHQTWEVAQKNARNIQKVYDLAREERLRKKERRILKGKGKSISNQGCITIHQISLNQEVSHVTPAILRSPRKPTVDQDSVFHGFVEECYDSESGRVEQPVTAANESYEKPKHQLPEDYLNGSNVPLQYAQFQVSHQSSDSSTRTSSLTNRSQELMWSKTTEQTNMTSMTELEVLRLDLSGSVRFPLDFSSAGPTMLKHSPDSEVGSYRSEEPSTPHALTKIATSISPPTEIKSLIPPSRSSSRKRPNPCELHQSRNPSIINCMPDSIGSSISSRTDFGSSLVNAGRSEDNPNWEGRYRVPDNGTCIHQPSSHTILTTSSISDHLQQGVPWGPGGPGGQV